jgi:hypothetical protein
VLDNPAYIVSAGADTQVIWGCLLDVVNALTAVGSAVALFPVVKRQNEAAALGFVAARLIEAAVIMIGVVSLLAVVTLRQSLAGSSGVDTPALLFTGQALVAVRDWTFLLGPGLMPAFNAVLLGSLLYRSRLVPRVIPTMGLVGAPLLLAADLATLFGYTRRFPCGRASPHCRSRHGNWLWVPGWWRRASSRTAKLYTEEWSRPAPQRHRRYRWRPVDFKGAPTRSSVAI